jgi:hypothetical protein
MQIGLEQGNYNRQFSYRHPIDIGTQPIALQGPELTLFDGQFHCFLLESKCNEIRRIEIDYCCKRLANKVLWATFVLP